ncbi:MAG: tetratricopeptide repeat protein [Lachnospiraceae bacterium]|nr:tetratricopeptide repeat protein [Lachnospiraceae bacterium]
MKVGSFMKQLVAASMICCLFSLTALTGCGNAASSETGTSDASAETKETTSVTETEPSSEAADAGETPAETEAETEPETEPPLTWEDLYKQGQEYFSEENYEEAIQTFTEAIGLDPDQAPVYVGRGDSYVLRQAEDEEEVGDNLSLAWADYETASGLDETCAPAYLGMADVLIRRESFEEAYELLKSASAKAADNTAILEKTREIESGKYVDSSSQIRRMDQFDPDGSLTAYTVYEYDFLGRKIGWRNYAAQAGEPVLSKYIEVTFDDNDLPIRNDFYDPDGTISQYQTMEYDENGLEIRRDVYVDGEHKGYYLTYYDESGRETGYDTYDVKSGEMLNYWRYDYDEEGNLLQESCYSPAGELLTVRKPSDD